MAGPRNPIVRALFRFPVVLFRLRLGGIFGGRLLLLETVGRSTGRVRRAVIEVARADPATHRYWVVAGWGRSSDWYRNALAHPPRLIDTGRDRLVTPAVHELDESERFELLRDYQTRNPRIAQALGDRLLGKDFTADSNALQELAGVLGALRFSPSAADH
jgi:deazaflavin-dependent oxidoreductase (nitroreductase family)